MSTASASWLLSTPRKVSNIILRQTQSAFASLGWRGEGGHPLLSCDMPPETLCSAASTRLLPASALFGFLSAEMASCSCASTCSFFFFTLSSLLLPRLLWLSLLENMPLCLVLPVVSPLGMLARSGSLPSRLRPGIMVKEAERIRARAPEGPRDTLRRSLSSESTRSSVL